MIRGAAVLLGLLLLSTLGFAQAQQPDSVVVSLSVMEKETGHPLPYAHVLTSSKKGVVTDGNGEVTIRISRKDSLTVSYQSYQNAVVKIPENFKEQKFFAKVLLSEETTYLSEVEVFPFPANVSDFQKAFMNLGNFDYRSQDQKTQDRLAAELERRSSMSYTPRRQAPSAGGFGIGFGFGGGNRKQRKQLERIAQLEAEEKARQERELMESLRIKE